jgi:ATP/maltotriose-dependent transcriptional regulator MalT
MSTTATQLLIGRDLELRLLVEALNGLPDHGAALALRGEAGIGKTVLLEAARGMATERGVRVLYTAGVASESDLPFSGLHRLLRPVMEQADELAPAYRSALLGAFGIGEDPGGDPFLVGLATLDLLSRQAASQSLLVIADDLHWIDAPSRDAIAFVGRRVESDPIVLLVSSREGYESDVGDLGLAEYVLHRLSDSDSSALLDARAPGLPDARRERLLAEASGNPLAIVELPAVATRGSDDEAAMPLNARLERAFAARLDDLPDATEAVLLVAAADESLALSQILAAGEILLGRPATVAMLRPGVDAGLVALVGTGLQFRHPLVRSAIYQTADVQRRTAAHRALAQVFAGEPDRRALHRAAAALGPDESVALDLEEMAVRVQRRGAVLEAATSLGRAAQLSEDRGARARRLLRAAELAFEVGRADLVQGFVEEARSLGLGARDRARAQWLSEIFYDGVPGDAGRVVFLVETAERACDDDQDLALKLLFGAALRCWWTDPGADARDRVVAAAERLPVDPTDSRIVQIIALAQPISRSGWVMERVAEAAPSLDDPEGALRLGMAAHAVGDFANSMRILRFAIEPFRAQGRLGLLTHAVGMFASAAVFVCDWAVAAAAAAEYEALARETNQPVWRGGAAVMQCAVAGMRGDDELAEAFAAEAERLDSSGVNLSVLQNSRGLAALAAGRYEDAFAHLARAFDSSDPAYHHREKYVAVGNFAEAAVATGREDEVRGLMAELTASAEPAVERALLAGLHYARAILADDDHAEAEFASALKAVGPRWVFNHARLNLAYGAWLRRHRRVIDSRDPLRAARVAFDELHTPAWCDRARRELRAAGETSRTRQPEAWDELSAQELQIATLAAAGLSNREIGQRLYISHRTVANHLYRIFPKLGVTTRGQLAGALPDRAVADSAGSVSPIPR